MNLANKSFRNNKTGEIIKVIDSFEDIAILENKKRASAKDLLNLNLYTEQIDVKNFFNTQGAYNQLAEKIKNIPTENIVDDTRGNMVIQDGMKIPINEGGIQIPTESAVIGVYDPEQEKAELARKYGASMDTSSVERQNSAFAKILGDEAPQIQLPETKLTINNTPQVESKIEYIETSNPVKHNRVEDPIISMFKGAKKNVQFKMNVEVSSKIPRLDFIEMMEDTYDVSIIDFIAEEMTQNILRDPSQIKESIKEKIKKIVYIGEKKEKTVKTVKTATHRKPRNSKKIPSSPKPPADRLLKEGSEPEKPNFK
jgi:hypothetical protein